MYFQTLSNGRIGPIVPSEKLMYNYAVLIIDSATRYPFAYPLRAANTKNICDALIKMFEITGIASEMVLTSDNASYNKSKLMCEFLKRLGVTPRFSTSYHPEGHALVERGIQSLQNLIVKLAGEHRNGWTSYLGAALWSLRETKNQTTGLPPHLMVFGYLPRGPLAILAETWSGERNMPIDISVSADKYLSDLHDKLQVASDFADDNSIREQNRYVRTYNKHARDKHFVVGEQCLILQKDDTSSSMFAKWRGPAKIVEVKSPYSYIVSLDGHEHHLHANKLRKFRVRADTVTCDNVMYINPDCANEVTGCNQCAIIYDADTDFGDIIVADPDSFRRPLLLPSQQIDLDKISHLSPQQRIELLTLLDDFPTVFAESPGLCTVTQHEVPLIEGFKPRVLRAYKVPENLKLEVDNQIAELLRLGFIELSNSPQVSPLVAVLKPKDKSGKRAVRTCIDFRYVNKYTRSQATV